SYTSEVSSVTQVYFPVHWSAGDAKEVVTNNAENAKDIRLNIAHLQSAQDGIVTDIFETKRHNTIGPRSETCPLPEVCNLGHRAS
ncbi:MAG: hypothetical protein ACK52K_13470, partial [Alphaproteobacteria bacterium]